MERDMTDDREEDPDALEAAAETFDQLVAGTAL